MPLVYYVPEYERDAERIPLDAERLLRLLGVTGKLSGFRYAVIWLNRFEISRTMCCLLRSAFTSRRRIISTPRRVVWAQSPHADPELLGTSSTMTF